MTPEWEVLIDTALDKTERLKVPGGWLYRTTLWTIEAMAVSMVFVPKRWWMQ